MEAEFKTNPRGAFHGEPAEELDITLLARNYTNAHQVYKNTSGRAVT